MEVGNDVKEPTSRVREDETRSTVSWTSFDVFPFVAAVLRASRAAWKGAIGWRRDSLRRGRQFVTVCGRPGDTTSTSNASTEFEISNPTATSTTTRSPICSVQMAAMSVGRSNSQMRQQYGPQSLNPPSWKVGWGWGRVEGPVLCISDGFSTR